MRKTLVTLTALGLAASGLTTTNIFSASTDTASLNGIGVHTGELAEEGGGHDKSVDLQLAPYDGSECGAFTEDLTRSVSYDLYFTRVVLPDGSVTHIREYLPYAQFCMRNVGTATAHFTATEFVDQSVDFDCTGEELSFDATCGGDLDGEIEENTNRWISESLSTPAPDAGYYVLNGGETKVYAAVAGWRSDANEDAAQTDKLVVRYVFDGSLA